MEVHAVLVPVCKRESLKIGLYNFPMPKNSPKAEPSFRPQVSMWSLVAELHTHLDM